MLHQLRLQHQVVGYAYQHEKGTERASCNVAHRLGCVLQDTIEGKLEKRTKGVFAPAGGKHLVAFIDDLNMPQKSKFGFIPPLELLKLWVDNGFW